MNAGKNVHGLESDLEDEKRDLRKDLESITEKAGETRAELSPTSLVRERILLLSGVALALGFRSATAVSRLKIQVNRLRV
jgi:hypothetical protein